VTIDVKCRKRFVNVRLHCTVNNLKSTSKISALPPMENFPRTPMERELGAILTNFCRLLLCAMLLSA